MIAALYVQPRGCYYGLDGVDPWDEARDARSYAGPYPVVAHPPCERWGKFHSGGLRNYDPEKYRLGDDGGCFSAALASARAWGGVIEHPAGTKAYAAHGLGHPQLGAGWQLVDPAYHGWACVVEQGHFGHPARKKTWLLAYHLELPDLPWGPSSPVIPADRSERWKARAAKDGVCVLLSSKARARTPDPFRDMLIKMARTSKVPYARTGPSDFAWVPEGQAYFEYTGPVRVFPKPWETRPETPAQVPQAARAVALGDRPVEDLPEALKALSGQPNVTGALRRLSREFGQVPTKIFVDVAEQAGVNRHTAIKQARLGRQGIE